MNPKTYEPTLYASCVIQLPDNLEIVLLETTRKLDSILPEVTISMGRCSLDGTSMILYLLYGNRLLDEVCIEGSLDNKLDMVSRWLVDHFGTKALPNLPRLWQNCSDVTILDKIRLPKIRDVQYISYIRKDSDYSLLRIKLGSSLEGLLDINGGKYTIFIDDWGYRLSKRIINTFYKDFIQPGGKGNDIQKKMEDLVDDLESKQLHIFEKCIDGYSSGILRATFNIGYEVHSLLTFTLENNEIEVCGELGKSKSSNSVYSIGDLGTISNLILQLIICEGMISESIIDKLEKLK